MPRPSPVVSAYDATDEGADAVALARLLGELVGGEVLVTRVLDATPTSLMLRPNQQELRDRIQQTKQAVLAAIPGADRLELVPVIDSHLARGLQGLAGGAHAAFLVLGSTHHSRLGRVLLGTSAEVVVHGAPCPVAVAPPGFHARAQRPPEHVTAAYDGTPAARRALEVARELTDRAGAALRVVGVKPHAGKGPLPGTGERHVDRALAELDVDGAQVDLVRGDPARRLVAASREADLMVMGARERTLIGRALTGSVSARVLRRVEVPVVICPAD
jgi:nucleotide-binding universal stress UspA family protein